MGIWTTEPVGFESILQSERVITGCASQAVFDRLGELITADALEKAIPMFKKLPIITVEHRDLPVGVCDDVWMDGDKLMIKARVKDTPDCDAIWNLIQKGTLNSFSITGRRTSSTCNVSPGHCVTDGIYLTSITICSNAVNQNAYLEIQKSLFGEDKMEEDAIKAIIQDAIAKSFADAAKETTLDNPDAGINANLVTDLQKSHETLVSELSALTDLVKAQTETIEALQARIGVLEDDPIQKAELEVVDTVAKEINGNPLMKAFAKTYRNPTGAFKPSN